ncbi:MAG TPA: hypothetical protein VF145_01795, partial [Chitinophagaceae bacterium]
MERKTSLRFPVVLALLLFAPPVFAQKIVRSHPKLPPGVSIEVVSHSRALIIASTLPLHFATGTVKAERKAGSIY